MDAIKEILHRCERFFDLLAMDPVNAISKNPGIAVATLLIPGVVFVVLVVALTSTVSPPNSSILGRTESRRNTIPICSPKEVFPKLVLRCPPPETLQPALWKRSQLNPKRKSQRMTRKNRMGML